MHTLRIVFFGSPTFASTTLEHICAAGYLVVGVVTSPDKPSGRGQKITQSAVKLSALKLGLPIFQPTNLQSPIFQKQLIDMNPNLGLVIAFRMLPEMVWNFPVLGTVNLHASLLPQYRGAAPIHHAIINGETETGLSTFFLQHAIDTGNIIATCITPIGPNETMGELHDRMMQQGASLVGRTLFEIANNTTKSVVQQSDCLLNMAPKIDRGFCELSSGLSPNEFHNKVRGLSPNPGAWISSPWGDMKIHRGSPVFSAEIRPEDGNKISQALPVISGIMKANGVLGYQENNATMVYPHGNFHFVVRTAAEKKIYIQLAVGFYEIIKLQLPNRPLMAAADFVNGLKK
ncbi:MAG: methionyl-tRNA formyltransferase [Flavobacteriaceae bacterium]|nr:methionyl-tRNA formyltransferase [Flavobacteriaceae bacterium]